MQFESNLSAAGFPIHKQGAVEISVGLPLGKEIKVACYSQNRDDTSYEVFDENEQSMGRVQLMRALGLNTRLVDDVNVLLAEFGVQLEYELFRPVSVLIIKVCESRYGYGRKDGDVIITIR